MVMIMTLKQAAQQALETLEAMADDPGVSAKSWEDSGASEAIMDLHSVLAKLNDGVTKDKT